MRLFIKPNCIIVFGESFVSVMHTFSCHLFFILFFLPLLASVIVMSSSHGPNAYSPEFRDLLAFPVTRYVHEYVNYLDSRRFPAVHESGADCNNITGVPFVGACVKQRLHCGSQGMSVSQFISSGAYAPFLRCYGEVDYQWVL